MAEQGNVEWRDEDDYWRTNYRTRPYASAENRSYEFYRPGYRYGVESARRFRDRDWNDVESELSKNWNSYEYRGDSTWEHVKAAVRDAWDRVTGRHTVGAHH